MQDLRVCLYDAGTGPRVGSVLRDRIYDLNLCCVTGLVEDGKADASD